MYRIIYTAKQQQVLPASQQVNRVGRYIYNHIDGAYKYEKTGNTFDVYTVLYYQVIPDSIPPHSESIDVVYEMKININITTYQNKLRVNTIEITPDERTLGFDLFKPDDLMDLPKAYTMIINKIRKRIERAYQEYNFIY